MPLYTTSYPFYFRSEFSLDIQFPLPSSFTWIYIRRRKPLHGSIKGIRYNGNKKQNVKILNDVFKELEGYLNIRNNGFIFNNDPRYQFILLNLDYPFNDLRSFCKMNGVNTKGNKFELLLRLYISKFRRRDRKVTILPKMWRNGHISKRLEFFRIIQLGEFKIINL